MPELLANQVSRQWWEELVSPATRNHLWLTNGLAAYSELLWTEHATGAGAMEAQLHDVMVEALTVDNVPIIQSARLEDYSPELWALTGSKGAAVLHMLRYVIGDDKFFAMLRRTAKQNAWKAVTTDDFRKVAESRVRPGPGLLLHPVDRIERRAGVQAGIHHLPHARRASA